MARSPSCTPSAERWVSRMHSVSVVMAVFNGGGRLRPSVASILGQEGCDLELVVVDDGSTDASGEELDRIASEDSRVVVVHQENRGLTQALRRGCGLAQGRFIARQDCGDISLPGRLRAQVEALEADSRLAFVSCWSEFRGPASEFLSVVRGTGRAVKACSVLDPADPRGILDWPSSHGSVVFGKDAYERAGGYRQEFFYGQDWDLWYRLASVGWFRMIDRPLYVYRVDEAGISAGAVKEQRQLAALSLEAMRRRAAGRPDDQLLSQAARIRPSGDSGPGNPGAGAYFIGSCLFRNRDRAAVKYLRSAVRAEPRLLKAWLKLAAALVAGKIGLFR